MAPCPTRTPSACGPSASGGSATISSRCTRNVTPDVAAALQRQLDAHLNPRVQDRAPRFADVDASIAGDSPDEHVPDPRTADQKRHDAFAGILSAAASAVGQSRRSAAPPRRSSSPFPKTSSSRTDGVAFVNGPTARFPCRQLSHGTSDATARSIASRSVRTARSRPCPCSIASSRTGSGRRSRARDGGCVIPGCRVRAAWCEVHHLIRPCTRWPDRRGEQRPALLASSPHHRDQRVGDPDARWRTAGEAAELDRSPKAMAICEPRAPQRPASEIGLAARPPDRNADDRSTA